jgi:WD40 repeat protein
MVLVDKFSTSDAIFDAVVEQDPPTVVFTTHDAKWSVVRLDLTTGQQTKTQLGSVDNGTANIFFSPDGQDLFGQVDFPKFLSWDATTGKRGRKPILTLTAGISGVSSVNGYAFCGSAHVISGESGKLVVWSLKTGGPIGNILTERSFSSLSTSCSDDGRFVALFDSTDKQLLVWDVPNKRVKVVLGVMNGRRFPQLLGFSSSGSALLGWGPALASYDLAENRFTAYPLGGIESHQDGTARINGELVKLNPK